MSTQTTRSVPGTGTTFALVGAGPGLGAAAARRFAAEGFAVALLARTPSRLDDLVAELRAGGTEAAAYAADVRDRAALRQALQDAADQLGPVEVLQYSPKPAPEFLRPVLETGADELVGPVETSVYGPAAAVEQVLPGMRSLGSGSVLFVNGASAVRPAPGVAGTSVAFAAQSAYAQLLHDALAPEGIHVGQLVVPLGIGGGDPAHEPDALADRLWGMHVERGDLRVFAAPLDPPADAPAQGPRSLRVVLDLGEGTQVTGELEDNATARSLLEQLPLTLEFTDFGGQEKIAALPAPLSLEGAPARSDASALTIGYYTPSQSLVLYYEDVGTYGGIVPLGRLDDVGPVVARTDDFTATVRAAG